MLTINDLAQSKLRPASLDKLHGQRKAINLYYSGDEVYATSDDEETEKIRQELENITSKTIYVIDKGGGFVDEFFNDVKLTNPSEIIDLENFYELRFSDFSLYCQKRHHYWHRTFMDAREIILPPKSTVKKGAKRLYIVKIDGKIYKLPELEYPKIVVQFLKWAKKKKKLAFNSIDNLWNYDKKIVYFDVDDRLGRGGAIDWYETDGIYYGNSFFCDEYPIKNLKTEDDLKGYNVWLQSDYKSLIEASNKIYNDCWESDKKTPGGQKYRDFFWSDNIKTVPGDLKPTEITVITQGDIDQFIAETNNRYQVRR